MRVGAYKLHFLATLNYSCRLSNNGKNIARMTQEHCVVNHIIIVLGRGMSGAI